MKLGVDFGTNRIVVAAADRGNYPLVSFEGPEGSCCDWFPSLVAVRERERRYGWHAWEAQTDESWTVLRSIKRFLENAGPETRIDLGAQQVKILDLLHGLAAALLTALHQESNLHPAAGEQIEVMVGVPANANSNQRYLTIEAFRAAGFHVLGVLNEPSAASIEFGHRQSQGKTKAETILVYDLGGGTFDASLVTLDENVHHVVASEGIPTVGGDDFDQILADLALDSAKVPPAAREAISPAAWFRLLEECRVKKEALNPNSRRIVIDLEPVNRDWGMVLIPVADFYEQARPLMEETIAAAEELLARHQHGQFEALYVTGGGSELPLVARVLRERFGRRVRRSAYTRSATAIGLAIQADQPDTYRLSDRLSRHFGVWRETDSGARIVFDPLFAKGVNLPGPGEPSLEIRRAYHPLHNVGHFRFLECSHRNEDGSPTGEVMLWDEIRFPFDPSLASNTELDATAVCTDPALLEQEVEELYRCDSTGAIAAIFSNRTSDYSRAYRLGHWNTNGTVVKPTARKRKASKASAASSD
jgi:molecular chaperone DnaK (HSP70)